MSLKADWTPLRGGNVNAVSRRGEVVRRRLGASSPAVHELLEHLEARGVLHIPRLHGRDAEHEYLSYLPGAAVFRPWPEAVKGDLWLSDLGAWLNAYHTAVRGFRTEAPFLWGPAHPEPGMVVCHGDLGPWNLLHQSGRLAGVIDWDLARYGEALDDVAELALEAVPLHGRHAETVGQVTRGQLERRLAVFCQAYGASPDAVVHHAPDYLKRTAEETLELAGRRVAPFNAFSANGVVAALEADRAHLLAHWR